MNNALINNYNSVVSSEDAVYLLGDIAHGIELDDVWKILKIMSGRKILLLGNHDVSYDYAAKNREEPIFDDICDFKVIYEQSFTFVLMHYPLLSWPSSRDGAVMLHGHIHARPEYNRENQRNGLRRLDVGIDANNYRPVSLDEIIRMVSAMPEDTDWSHMEYYLDAETIGTKSPDSC